MKALRPLVLPVLFAVCGLFSLKAQTPELQKLDPLFRDKFMEAAQAYNLEQFDKSLQLADEAEKIQSPTAAIPNLRGAIALDRGDFDKAKEQFEVALRVNPKFQPAAYNLAEIPFRQKNFTIAREKFQQLLAKDPKDELVQYRIFLCLLLENRRPDAEKMLEEIPFPGATPAHYYAEAALALEDKNMPEAEGRFRVAKSIFGAGKCRLFAEPLEYLGWIKKPVMTSDEFSTVQ